MSLAYTFNDAKAPTRKKLQYFDNNGSRAIYQDGWIAATFGPLVPWLPGAPGLANGIRPRTGGSSTRSAKDFSEADDLAAREPKRLAQLQKTFDEQARANKVYPARRRHLATPASRRPHQDALYELAFRRHHGSHA